MSGEPRLEALGAVVRRLRKEAQLTQEQLGIAAKYGGGAGVAISRLEKGTLNPTQEKLEGIATALGLSVQELKALATKEAANGTNPSNEERLAAILRASEQRSQLAEELEALDDARREADRSFLLAFWDVAGRITDAPALEEGDVIRGDLKPSTEEVAEASFQIEFTRYGVSRALAAPQNDVVADKYSGDASYYRALADAVALATAPLGATVPNLAGAAYALNGLRGAMGLGAPTMLPGVAGVVAAVAAGAAVKKLLERQAKATRSRRLEASAAALAEAEAEVAGSQPSVEALLTLVPQARELFEYIAVHATHALARWESSLGAGVVNWSDLSKAQRQRYDDFVAVTAAQLSAATVNLQNLANSQGGDLAAARALADELLAQARREIKSRV